MLKPVPPQKTIICKELRTDTKLRIQDGDLIELGGISYTVDVDYGYDSDEYYLTECIISHIENPHYNEQLADYNIRLKEYNEYLEKQKIAQEKREKRLEEMEREQLRRLKKKYEGGT